MTIAHIGLGSNLGDRAAMLRSAIDEIGRTLPIVASSAVYETAPWGRLDQPAFLNCCVAVETAEAPAALLGVLHEVETRLGRTRRERWGPRTIDADLLLYGEARIATADLVVPHPRLTERAFVLVPLAEIAPETRVPGTELTVRDALARLDRVPGDVRRVAPPIAPPRSTAR
ncbi:MAG TPA: 2-amino-4-hydroxy-6-hydroxymethyldihydropteridine diphosphokinase [Candidatus Limnocylindria bacterium]|nr:2-amino-4-hydroxy-6-hydroxymethyldihydropteridine diphosphokinase [Candidatus Limnocylindria bacterium]